MWNCTNLHCLLQLNANVKLEDFGEYITIAMMDDIKRLRNKQASKYKETGKAEKYSNLTDFK